MPWQIVLLISLGQLPFYPLHFQCHEISLRVSLKHNFFAGVTFYETSSSFLSHLFPHINKSAFTKSFWLHIQSLQWRQLR